MILKERRFWFGILLISVCCMGWRLFTPRHDQKFFLLYTLDRQFIKLGELPIGVYTLTTDYISGGDLAGGPDSRIEVFDLSGVSIYTNIHKNSNLQIIPTFELFKNRQLKASVELTDASPVTDAELVLFLRQQDRLINYFVFWFGFSGLFFSICALFYLRKTQSKILGS